MKKKLTRKLSAIMFTDIQGYTALMQEDEHKGMIMRERHRKVFKAVTSEFSGTILQYYGDGTLSTFDSVVSAVKCGIEMQKEFSRDLIVPLRVGIHLGDIVTTAEEVIGDAVNVASRIETLAIAGSILISDRVQKELNNHRDIQCFSLGYYEMKNVEEPMEIFAISNDGLKVPSPDQISEKVKPYQSKKNQQQDYSPDEGMEEQHRSVTLTGPGGGSANRVDIKVSKKKKTWYYITSAAVIIGIIGSIAGTANIIKLNFFSNSSNSTQLTVYVHGPNGPQDLIIENEGEVMIDFDGDRRTARIGENGRTVFTEIPEKFKGEPLHIMVKSENYMEADPDKQYQWDEEAIYVPMIMEEALGTIKGIVKNADGSTLINKARIIIDNEFTTMTDSLGRFNLKLEGDKVLEKYNILILKEGYQPSSEYYYPNSSKEFRLTKI